MQHLKKRLGYKSATIVYISAFLSTKREATAAYQAARQKKSL